MLGFGKFRVKEFDVHLDATLSVFPANRGVLRRELSIGLPRREGLSVFPANRGVLRQRLSSPPRDGFYVWLGRFRGSMAFSLGAFLLMWCLDSTPHSIFSQATKLLALEDI